MYLHRKNGPVSFRKCLKMFCFHHFHVLTRCRFQNVSVRVPFSKSIVFKICRQKMCRFRVNGRPIRRIFHRFQNVLASCERSLKCTTCEKRYGGISVNVFVLSRPFRSCRILSRPTLSESTITNPKGAIPRYLYRVTEKKLHELDHT